jgi:hypothetical protein
MAVFLLIYLVLLALWFFWSTILAYHLFKYRIPKDRSRFYFFVYCLVCGFILVVSFVFIVNADWTTVPNFLEGL